MVLNYLEIDRVIRAIKLLKSLMKSVLFGFLSRLSIRISSEKKMKLNPKKCFASKQKINHHSLITLNNQIVITKKLYIQI